MARDPAQTPAPRAPLRDRIARELETDIRRNYRAGARLPSESRLAERFEVSTLTLREALAVLAEKGLIERKHGVGSFVADPAANRHVGVFVGVDISDPACAGFWLPTTQHLRAFIEGLGYRVQLYMGHVAPGGPTAGVRANPAFMDDLENDRLLGLALLATPELGKLTGTLAAHHVPIVGASGGAHQVLTDYPDILRRALACLKRHGRQRIGLLSWGLTDAEICAAFADAGFALAPERIARCREPGIAGSGYDELHDMLARGAPPLDGLVIMDELLYANASYAILEAGLRVPEDMLVVTHANEGARVFSPVPAARIVVSPLRMAEMLGGVLTRLMRGDCVPPGRRYVPLRTEELPLPRRTAPRGPVGVSPVKAP